MEPLLSQHPMSQVQAWLAGLPTTPLTGVYNGTRGSAGTRGHVLPRPWNPWPSRPLFPLDLDAPDLVLRSNGGKGSKGFGSLHKPREFRAKLIFSFVYSLRRLGSLLQLHFGITSSQLSLFALWMLHETSSGILQVTPYSAQGFDLFSLRCNTLFIYSSLSVASDHRGGLLNSDAGTR